MNELLQRLDSIADLMNSQRFSWFAKPSYDMMADAIWWSDERPKFDNAKDHWCLRPVFRYRTSLILDSPDSRYLSFWERAIELFPNWPGFHPSRIAPNSKLRAFHASNSKIAMDSFLAGVDDPEFREELRRETED